MSGMCTYYVIISQKGVELQMYYDMVNEFLGSISKIDKKGIEEVRLYINSLYEEQKNGKRY